MKILVYKAFIVTGFVISICFFWNQNCYSQAEQISIDNSEKNTINHKFYFSEGLKNVMLGNIEQAKVYFNKCIEINSDSHAAMFELAKAYISQNDLQAAENYSLKSTLKEPKNIWYKQLLATIYHRKGKHEEAQKIYEDLIYEYPEQFDYFEILIGLYLTGNKPLKAIKLLERIENKIGFNEEIILKKEQIYRSAGDFKSAQKEIKRLIKKFPDEARYYGVQAELFAEKGDNKNAIKSYNEVIRLEPDNGVVHLSLYEFYLMNKQHEKANEELFIAFRNVNIDVKTKVGILIGLIDSDRDNKYVTIIDQLTAIMMEIYPDEPDALILYADKLIKEEKPLEARVLLRKIIEEEKSKFFVWQKLLFIENDLQDFKMMFEESKNALEYFPDQAIFYLMNGVSANQLKFYDHAIESLKKGSRLVFNNLELSKQFYISLGEAYYNLGNYKESDLNFDNLLAIEPDNILVLNNYSYYLSVRKENLEKAEKMIRKCVSIEKNNATYLDTFAWVLFQKGEYNESLKQIEDAVNIGKDISDVILEHYGDILFMLGQKDEAKIQWKKALNLGQGSGNIEYKIKNGLTIE